MLRKISGSGQSSDNFRGQDGRLPDVPERRVHQRRNRVSKVVRDERHGQEKWRFGDHTHFPGNERSSFDFVILMVLERGC